MASQANQTPLLWCNIVPSVYVFLAHSSSLIGILKDANFIWLNYIPQNPIFSFSLLATVTLLRRTANSPSFLVGIQMSIIRNTTMQPLYDLLMYITNPVLCDP